MAHAETLKSFARYMRRVENAEVATMAKKHARNTFGCFRFGSHFNVTPCRDARARLIADVRRDVGPDALMAYPTVPHVAPLVKPVEQDDALYVQTNARTLRSTMLGKFLEWCGVSLPCGKDGQGLPVGFLLSAPGGKDAHLLGFALDVEEILCQSTR